MVEMMLRKMFKYMLSAVALCTVGTLCAQEVAPRIAGLEGNEEYMSLLREDARLQFREDSVTRVIEESRRLLREEPETRAERSQQILALESEVFEIRSAKGRLIDRINTIEQDWILSNLGSEPTPESEQPALRPGALSGPEPLFPRAAAPGRLRRAAAGPARRVCGGGGCAALF